ncbi:MAG: hypothetical protein J0M18_18495 [Ignavibacteria bacterium]|nr:hypothetical protein [Ignavibacteria bacterium]
MKVSIINPTPKKQIKKILRKKNPSRIKKTNSNNLKNEVQKMAAKKRTTNPKRRKRNPSTAPVVYRNPRHTTRRRRNPAGAGFSTSAVMETVTTAVMTAGGAIGVRYLVNKMFDLKGWMNVAAQVGIALAGGYALNMVSKTAGKALATGGLTAAAIQAIDMVINPDGKNRGVGGLNKKLNKFAPPPKVVAPPTAPVAPGSIAPPGMIPVVAPNPTPGAPPVLAGYAFEDEYSEQLLGYLSPEDLAMANYYINSDGNLRGSIEENYMAGSIEENYMAGDLYNETY